MPVISRKTSTSFLFLLSFYAFILLPLTPLWAQPFELSENTDIFAPLIRHQPIEEALQSGGTYKIEARVSDNIGVTEVILYYRTQGQEIYSSINMETIWRGEYTTHIPKEDIEVPGIEYYIQASDQAGNISQRAFPFSPLTIDVFVAPKDKSTDPVPPPPVAQKKEKILMSEILSVEREPFALSTEKPVETQAISEKKPWYKKWWVWTIALAVVGGVAAAGSGGGGGGAGAPTTGSIDVSGPVP
ncbi:MAG: hypothetical protein VST69_03890 [Nitrospirota bacterium]|nr:hypothetical protein [Nitrospirota bacterium]